MHAGTVNTVLGAIVGTLLVLLLVTAVALVNTCVALKMKNKERYSGMNNCKSKSNKLYLVAVGVVC